MALKDHLLNEETAKDVYNKRTKNIEKMMKELSSKLQLHSGSFRDSDYKDWGYAGDLGKVEKDLKEILDFIK